MKLKKKTAIITGFVLGAVLFATTALADIATKSGYEQLKDAVKLTAAKASDTFDSFTLDVTMVVKHNGQTVASNSETTKYDRAQGATESIDSSLDFNGVKHEGYYYSDRHMDIRKVAGDNKYYVTEYLTPRDLSHRFSNPFEEEEAEDIERIFDALVGNLKDYVVVNENPDGSKELSGAFSEAQIPALINALVSFQAKQMFDGREAKLPRLTDDIYIKEVTGNAAVNAEGVLERLLGTAILVGKDAQGQTHEISLEVLFKFTDINTTVIRKPDLSGAEVVKETITKERGYGQLSAEELQKFVGLFSNDIIAVIDGKFVKVGERYLEITSITDQSVTARYYEVYREGFEKYAQNKMEFEFNAPFNEWRDVRFETVDNSGRTIAGSLYFDHYLGKINLHIDRIPFGDLQYDYSYSPVLD